MKRLYKKLLNLGLYAGFLVLVMFQVYCGNVGTPSAQTACGFKQNTDGQRISLKSNLPLKMYFDSKFPLEYRAAVQTAINTWNTATGKTLFVIEGEITGTTPQHDSLNVIYWQTSWDQTSSATQDEQANTIFYWSDNEIIEADIVINGQNFAYSTEAVTPANTVDVQSLAEHEFGHAMGLVHVTDQTSVMNPGLNNAQDRRKLQPIDLSNISCEY